jgi:hypothetical protein
MHHDALEFPDGEIVLLTRLREGQEATVLQLPARPTTLQEFEDQRRAADSTEEDGRPPVGAAFLRSAYTSPMVSYDKRSESPKGQSR